MEALKVLVIQTAFPGDAILTLPMIQKLHEKYSGCVIDVVAIPSTEEIFSSSPYVNAVIAFDKHGKDKSFLSFIRLLTLLRKNKYNAVYSPHRSFRSALLVLGSGVKNTYGFDNSSLKTVYRHKISYRKDLHEVQRNFDLIGFKYDDKSWKILPQVTPSRTSKEKVESYLKQFGSGKFAAIAPGSVWETKKYPLEYYKESASFLSNEGFTVFAIGAADEKDICGKLCGGIANAHSTAGMFSIVETIELLRRMNGLLTNDSAPTHMAMCAGIPVLTIYCSTVPQFGFYPYNTNSAYISYDELDCKPCGIHGYKKCPLNNFLCGFNLKSSSVILRFKELLDDKRS